MRQIIVSALVFVGVLVGIAVGVHTFVDRSYQSRIESLEGQLSSKDNVIRAYKDKMNEELSKSENEIKAYKDKIEELERQAPPVRENNTNVEGHVSDIFGNTTVAAVVTLDRKYCAVTDTDGKYFMEKIPIEPYFLEVIRCPHEQLHYQVLGMLERGQPYDVATFPPVRVKGVFAEDVNSREPAGQIVEEGSTIKSSFFKSKGDIYLHNRFFGVQKRSRIKHIWYHDGERIGKGIILGVVPSLADHGWRTQSSRSIRPDQIGLWEVKVTTIDGEEIATFSFRVVEG